MRALTLTLVHLAAAALLALPLSLAHAVPLDIVTVGAPAVNCVFDPTCTILVTDSVGTFAVPGMAGVARLQSRTFTGSPGAPAAGLYGYEYRIDLRDVAGILDINCVTSFRITFGPVADTLDYDASGIAGEHVYVITSGGLGNVAPTAADKVGNTITFFFGTPVCAGSAPGNGDSTFFFGLASARPPRAVTAQVTTFDATLDVGARAPKLPLVIAFDVLKDLLMALPPPSLVGPTPGAREGRRRAMLERVAAAESAAEGGQAAAAAEILSSLASKMDGRRQDWVMDDPRTDLDERAVLLRAVQEAIEAAGETP